MIVNFGCGANPAPDDGECINIDGSLTVLLARLPIPSAIFGSRAGFVRMLRSTKVRYGTARHLRLKASSLDGFYASHVLEHLPRKDCEDLLSRVLKWLKPTGVLRVVLPDLHRSAEAYVEGTMDAAQFVAATRLARDRMTWWDAALGHSQHRWMYDAASFSKLLTDIGFRRVMECKMGESRMPEMGRLDIPSRQSESFYIEAGK